MKVVRRMLVWVASKPPSAEHSSSRNKVSVWASADVISLTNVDVQTRSNPFVASR